MTDKWTSVSYISTSAISPFLYSNGIHSVGINVTLQAVNEYGNTIKISDDDLYNSITLTDYYDSNNKLVRAKNYDQNAINPEGWYFVYDRDEIVDSPIGDEQLDSAYQSIVFYVVRVGDVSTTIKSIGVIVNPTDADTSSDPIIFSNNNNSNKNKFATFSVKSQIHYTMSNIKFWKVIYSSDIKPQVDDSQYTNYYVAPAEEGFNFVRSQIFGPGLDLRNNVVALKVDYYSNLRSIYMWDIGPVSTQHGLGWEPFVTATVNDVYGAFTITRTWQKNKRWGRYESAYQCGFKVYDQYGNSGLFYNQLESGLYGPLPGRSTWDANERFYDVSLVT